MSDPLNPVDELDFSSISFDVMYSNFATYKSKNVVLSEYNIVSDNTFTGNNNFENFYSVSGIFAEDISTLSSETNDNLYTSLILI